MAKFDGMANIDGFHFTEWCMKSVYMVRNAAALCEKMGVEPAHMSRIRNRKLKVPASMLIKAHEYSGVPIKEIRSIIEELAK